VRPITVSAVQAEAVPGDVAGNAARAAALARITADHGATLAVFPELFLPAYHPPALRRPATDVVADGDGWVADARLDPLRAAARERAVVVVVGAAVRYPDGRRTCAALVVDRAGEVAAAYDKQHLCGPDEKALFTPGVDGATLVVDEWRFGLGSCYDGCFPSTPARRRWRVRMGAYFRAATWWVRSIAAMCITRRERSTTRCMWFRESGGWGGAVAVQRWGGDL
jgi:predicted amidohydrolase